MSLAVLAAASSSGTFATFATTRLASSRVRLIARQAVRRGEYVENRGKCGSARLVLDTKLMTNNSLSEAPHGFFPLRPGSHSPGYGRSGATASVPVRIARASVTGGGVQAGNQRPPPQHVTYDSDLSQFTRHSLSRYFARHWKHELATTRQRWLNLVA